MSHGFSWDICFYAYGSTNTNNVGKASLFAYKRYCPITYAFRRTVWCENNEGVPAGEIPDKKHDFAKKSTENIIKPFILFEKYVTI